MILKKSWMWELFNDHKQNNQGQTNFLKMLITWKLISVGIFK